jgi:hypothetical protein
MGTLLSPPAALTPADYLTYCLTFLNYQKTAGGALDALQQACSIGTAFDSHDIQCIYPTRLVNFSQAFAAPWSAGQLAGDNPPPNSAGTIDRYTENGTRAGRGNLHPPVGTRAAIQGDGTWDPPIPALLTTIAVKWTTAFDSFFNAHDMLPVLWNKTNPLVINRMLGYKVNKYIRTMRRRTVGLGI